MKSHKFISGALLALSYSTSSYAADAGRSPYLSDWWHQSVNVVGSYDTRFGPHLTNDLYLEYEAFARKDWFDFYGYIDLPKAFGTSSSHHKGIWDNGALFFMEIEPRISLDKLTNTHLGFGPFKEWYFSNNYIYEMGHNGRTQQSTWYMGLGTDIDTQTPLVLSMNVYSKYQAENYGAENEHRWDGYRFKVKYALPLTSLWGGKLSYIGFTNFDWGSDLAEKAGPTRTSNSIASSHILALNYKHWHYSFVARYFHNGGQWAEGKTVNFGEGPFKLQSTGMGYYLVLGYNF